jgi:hypothetical protein
MVTIASLWLPILASAIGVFIVSSIIHMVLTYHRSDWAKLPAEDEIMDALRPHNLQPGDYFMPHGEGMKAMSDPAFIEKMTRGPVVMLTVDRNGPPAMGASLVQWFLFCVLISVFVAYLTSRAVGADADYLAVFRFAGTTAFGGYGLALLEESIWYKRKWSTTLKNVFDGFIYALVTAGLFGWLWPAGS